MPLSIFCCIIIFTALQITASDLLQISDYIANEAENITSKDFKKMLQIKSAELYRLYANNNDSEKAALALLNASKLLLRTSDDNAIADAFVCATIVLKKYEKTSFAPQAMLLLGEIYLKMKEYGRAIKTWIECADKYPSASEVASQSLLNAGDTFKKSIKNKPEAVKQYSRIIEIYPSSPVCAKAYMNRAEIYADDKKFDLSVQDYLSISRKMPTNELADAAMYSAIDITKNEIKDYKTTYEMVVEFKQKFPNSSYLKKVEKIEAQVVKYASNL